MQEFQSSLSGNERQLHLDYVLSFRHSNGSDSAQKPLLFSVAQLYPRQMLQALTPEAAVRLEDIMAQMPLPSAHKTEVWRLGLHDKSERHDLRESREKTLRERWQWFVEAIEFVRDGKPIPMDPGKSYRMDGFHRTVALSAEDFFRYTMQHMVMGDIALVRRGRSMSADPHESFLRTYGLAGRGTGSSYYDQIYGDFRNRVHRAGFGANLDLKSHHLEGFPWELGTLAQEWEKKHPGLQFFKL